VISKSKSSESLSQSQCSSDWLCDTCGTQNLNTLASGAIRTKCFKCQSPRDVQNSTAVSVVKKDKDKDNPVTDKKSAPNPVFDLRANSKFISKAEKEKNELEKYFK
jgi:hypothetical protein